MPYTALALTEPVDPIFAAIERHRIAWSAFVAHIATQSPLEDAIPAEQRRTIYRCGEEFTPTATDDPRWIEYERGLIGIYAETERCEDELIDIEPTTLAGIAAALRYVSQWETFANGDTFGSDDYFVDDGDPKAELTWTCVFHRNLAAAIEKITEEQS